MAIYKMRAALGKIYEYSPIWVDAIPIKVKAKNADEARKIAEKHLPELAKECYWAFETDEIEILEVQDEEDN